MFGLLSGIQANTDHVTLLPYACLYEQTAWVGF